MAFTEQEIAKQEQEIARLADELKRLNSAFDEQKKAMGLNPDEEVTISDIEMTPALEQAMAEAKAEAEKNGRALASRLQPASTKSVGSARARRGAIRI